METEKIINRVRKMIALSQDSAASEGERDNALRMAHATLAKYNLTIGDTEEKAEQRIDSFVFISPHAWARTVIQAVAELYFCDYFFCKAYDGKVKHYFVGKESNVATAQEMSDYVVKSIGKEARKRTKEALEDGKFERDFCKGSAVSIRVRCHEIRKSAEQAEAPASASGTAVVLSSFYKQEKEANALVIATKHGKLSESKGRQSAPAIAAYQQGRSFGNTVSLNKQVSGDRSATTFLK